MPNSSSRSPWLIPGLVAAISFVGAVASNLIAAYVQESLRPYSRWVTLIFAIAFVVAVIAAIAEARRRPQSPVTTPRVEKTLVVNASAEGSVAVGEKVENSTIVTGDKNVLGNRFDGDANFRDKIINFQQAATAAAVNTLHQLRAPVGDFVGREQEIEALINALRHNSRASISGINGMGGIGKTELALLVANRLSPDYPDAQFFINLQGTADNPLPPQDVMAICIRAFAGPEAKLPEDLDQLSHLYRSQLTGKRVLLLLDNALDDKQVLPLLPPNGCALLVTSREAIALPGMTPFTLNPLTDTEARELLLEIAPRAQAAAEDICKFCGYLPLAIRAAGSLLAVTPDLEPVDYATQLKDERKRLERLGAKGVELGVEASFNLSYARLNTDAARVFRLLSVFPATFDAVAVEAVCADQDHMHLSELVRRNLVLYDSSTKRYRLHDLARLFVDSKLSTEEHASGAKRHAIYYVTVLAAAEQLYLEGGDALARGLALFDLEWGNIQFGHAWVATQGGDTEDDVIRLAMGYPTAGMNIFDLRQHPRDGIRWQEIALAAARRLNDRANEGIALCILGLAYQHLGEFQRAIQFFEEYLTIVRELRDRKNEASALGNLGNAYLLLGENEHAIQFYEQALHIIRETGNRRKEGIILGNLGVAHRSLGEIQRAIQFHEQELTMVREMGDRRGEGSALGNLGAAYYRLDEINRSIQFYEQALAINRELGDRRGEGACLWSMSLVLDQLGKRSQAIRNAEESLRIYEQIEDPSSARVRAKLAEWREESTQS